MARADDTVARVPALSGGPLIDIPVTFIVPLDGTDFSLRAIPVARRFATAFAADLHACTTPQTLDPRDRSTMPAWLEAVVADTALPRFTASVVDGDDPAHAVAELIAATPGSAVCMATHARGPIGSTALGHVARQVLLEVTAPVLLVGRHCADAPPEHGPLLVAHDGSLYATILYPFTLLHIPAIP